MGMYILQYINRPFSEPYSTVPFITLYIQLISGVRYCLVARITRCLCPLTLLTSIRDGERARGRTVPENTRKTCRRHRRWLRHRRRRCWCNVINIVVVVALVATVAIVDLRIQRSYIV